MKVQKWENILETTEKSPKLDNFVIVLYLLQDLQSNLLGIVVTDVLVRRNGTKNEEITKCTTSSQCVMCKTNLSYNDHFK